MLKKLACGKRKKLSLITNFLQSVGTLAKGSVGFVRNVFKKKSCGASPLNGEENKRWNLSITFDVNEKGQLVVNHNCQPCI
jgi:hypothetical protein